MYAIRSYYARICHQLQFAPPRGEERADRTGHEACRTGHRAGQTGPGQIDGGHLVSQTESPQAQGVGSEGVGLQQFGPGGRIILMNSADQRGVDQIKVFENRVGRGAPMVELVV